MWFHLEIDECGVCDGPGAVYDCGCANVSDGACDCDGNIFDCTGECGGTDIISCLDIYENLIPDTFTLSSYPNPFNPITTISFSIPESGFTNITVYDIKGRQLETLTNKVLYVGNYSVDWDASSHPSGIYLIKMVSGEYVGMRKLNLIK